MSKSMVAVSVVMAVVIFLVAYSAGLFTVSNPGMSDSLVIYSGRSRSLVQPIIGQYQEKTGIQMNVLYGSDSQRLAKLSGEGEHSPADVLWLNTAGALGA